MAYPTTQKQTAMEALAAQRVVAKRANNDYDRTQIENWMRDARERALQRPGVLPSALPNWDDQTRYADMVKAAQDMHHILGGRRGETPWRNVADGSPGAPANLPSTGAPPMRPMNAADIRLWHENYQGPNGPRMGYAPDTVHTDLRENGTVNPRPGMVRNTADGLFYTPGAPRVGQNGQKPIVSVGNPVREPYQIGRVTDAETVVDHGGAVQGLSALAASNRGKTFSAATPYDSPTAGMAPGGGGASVRFVTPSNPVTAAPGANPNDTSWHKGVMDAYPEVGKAGTPENKAFVTGWQQMQKQGVKGDPMALAKWVSETKTAPMWTPPIPDVPSPFAGGPSLAGAHSEPSPVTSTPFPSVAEPSTASRFLGPMVGGAVDKWRSSASGGGYNPSFGPVVGPAISAFKNFFTGGSVPSPAPSAPVSSPSYVAKDFSTPSTFAPQPFTMDNPSGIQNPLVAKKKKDESNLYSVY